MTEVFPSMSLHCIRILREIVLSHSVTDHGIIVPCTNRLDIRVSPDRYLRESSNTHTLTQMMALATAECEWNAIGR